MICSVSRPGGAFTKIRFHGECRWFAVDRQQSSDPIEGFEGKSKKPNEPEWHRNAGIFQGLVIFVEFLFKFTIVDWFEIDHPLMMLPSD
ncbi:MAG: hypothetical protein ACR2QF_15190 [Geminicoccaceae bacterium]